jgi:2-succinyl-5-enolpyruvyl-6-hydroxy-3-cyclohexene-1-carboxylate synthase
MIRQNLDQLATLLFAAGVRTWAVSPGSRNAPIVAGFLRHGGFQIHSFPDERCAAFAALGMSQATGYPCGVICTSGTAVLNLYPAICEAYYQRVPLVVITADRPAELIDQWDGQTIHQNEIFEKHILESFETPQELNQINAQQKLEEIIYDAVETSISPVAGPVHINIPLRDPIYEDLELPFFQTKPSKPFVFLKNPTAPIDANYLHAELLKYPKILIVGGQHIPDQHLQYELLKVSHKIPVLGDITANIQHCGIENWEAAFTNSTLDETLQPDLLITFGLSLTSKKLKNYLQKNKPKAHWHLSLGGFTGDPFQTSPETKVIDPAAFFATCASMENVGNDAYLYNWRLFCENGLKKDSLFLNKEHQKEFELVASVIQNCDHTNALQLGNSMTIRYAGMAGKTGADVYCNRGTSGIDGSLSTAVGFAIANLDKKAICILGDVSFFYDSNALWTNKLPQNLQIIILNNGGGKIFDYIDGPNKEKGLIDYIQTPHTLNAAHLAAHFHIKYCSLNFGIDDSKLFSILDNNEIQIIEFSHTNNE